MSALPREEPTAPRGRGTGMNPRNRFEEIEWVPDPAAPDDERPAPETRWFVDQSRSILAQNDSPDVPFEFSINPYRGCEHGCVYCFARPSHEYLGFSAGLDFETRIMVKPDAPGLLRAALMKPSWRPQVINVSGVTDCYQPIERALRLTRGCLEVLAAFRNPVGVITKSALVLRDADVLGDMASWRGALVGMSVTTLDTRLASLLEPRAARPAARLAAIEGLSTRGVPVHVMVAPVIPGLNDHELPAILQAAAAAGARSAGCLPVRLPHGVKDLFVDWLERHFPERKAKVLNRIRDLRGGRLNDPRFGSRMQGEGVYAEEIAALFRVARARAGLADDARLALETALFRRPGPTQGELFA